MKLFLLLTTFTFVCAGNPTLYKYYTSGGIKSGLEANNADHFVLNGRQFIIYGGSLHYFRQPYQYWGSVLRQYRAAGLNTVQIYIPWNIHEDIPDQLDFESPHLNLDHLLKEVKAADLFAIVRPGPYICAEIEFGGFPSWLLRNPQIRLRTNNKFYLERVKLYWDKVFSVLNKHQFSVSGGPVLMVQLENEFGGGSGNRNNIDYLHYLRNLTLESGFKQQLFTSDNIIYSRNNPIKNVFTDVLETANFGQDEPNLDDKLNKMSVNQPNRPLYVSEYWSGWFDAWTYKNADNPHQTTSAKGLMKTAEKIVLQHNGSINFYPFIGGTSFGFLNGLAFSQTENNVTDFFWVTTSYDYNAPINEGHQYTEKYFLIREFYNKLVSLGRLPKLHLPQIPKAPTLFAYGKISMSQYCLFEDILQAATKFTLSKAVSMEMLELGNGFGQRYGFVNYRIITKNQVNIYEVTGPIKDRGILLVDGIEQAVVFNENNCSIDISSSNWSNVTYHKLDMLVENMGRENHFSPYPKSDLKGIDSTILLDGVESSQIEIYSLDFNKVFMNKLEQLTNFKLTSKNDYSNGPTIYRGVLQVNDDQPKDTYLLMDGWTKGVVFVNDFNIGRYWNVGPQRALYVPGVLLNNGLNVIKVFELHKAGRELQFVDRQMWKN